MKLIKQVVFWSGVVLILVALFGKPYSGYMVSFYFVTFLLPVILGTSYVFNSFLIPKYLLKRNYLKFTIYTLYAIIISLNLEMLVVFLAFSVLANYSYANMVPASKNIFGLTITMYFIVLVQAFVNLYKISLKNHEEIQNLQEKQNTFQKGYIVVRSNRKNTKILIEEMEYIESLADYVKIYVKGQKAIITKEKISVLERKLRLPFIRSHRSFLINLDKVHSFSSESVTINQKELPLSRTYKKEVLKIIKQNNDKKGVAKEAENTK